MALNFPDSPTLNQVYTDTTSGFSYQWDGVVWQSYTPSATKNILVLDDISGSFNSSTTIFNLTNSGTAVTPANSQQLRVTLGGIVQEPGTDYIVAASTIIFTTAPDFGIDCSIVSLGTAVSSEAPNSGTIFARQEYNPTGVQTSFTFTNNYTSGYLEVYHNGVKLVDGPDFTATNGSTFDLTVAAQNGDVVEAVAYLQTSLYTLGNYTNYLTVVNNATVGGILTATSAVVGSANTFTEDLVVNGDARITGILTIGTSSITLDGTNNEVNVGTGVTIHHTNGVQVGGNTVHSSGLFVNQINVTGVVTATSFSGDGSALTGVDSTQIVSGITSIRTLSEGVGIGTTAEIIVGVNGIERIRTFNVGFGTNGQNFGFIGIGTSKLSTDNGNVRNAISIASTYNNLLSFESEQNGYYSILEFRKTGRGSTPRFAQIEAGTNSNDDGIVRIYNAKQSSGITKVVEITAYPGPYDNKMGLFNSNPDNVVGAGYSAFVSIDVANTTAEPKTGLRVTRNYGVHPGRSDALYAIQGCLNGTGSSGTNKKDMGGVYGFTAVELAGGIVGVASCGIYTNGIAVLADATQPNTDGYGYTNAFWGDIRRGSGATSGGLRGMYLNFVSDYANQEGIVWNTAYTGGNTLSIARWVRNGTQVGSITCTTSSTTYGTSSDYRLKENVVPLTGAIDRLKQIPVHRFNFISDPNKTVDGFIAHEVTPFVPEAVTGVKDEMEKVPVVDENGKPVFNEDGTQVLKDEPVYQSIDQSKLVPLLTAALQEALDKIDALQARLDAAGL